MRRKTQGKLGGRKEEERKRKKKTYNSGDSLVVTHRTTNPPVRCLISAEQTGRDISIGLWSYVEDCLELSNIYSQFMQKGTSYGV